MELTQYGKSVKAGGWDPDGDSYTDRGEGDWGLLLTLQACALTDSAAKALGVKPKDWVTITFEDGTKMDRQYLDRAPEDNERCDCYQPWDFVEGRSDYGDVVKALDPQPA